MTTSEATETEPGSETAAPSVEQPDVSVEAEANEPAPAPVSAPKVSVATKIKHTLLKIIDVTALGVLGTHRAPVLRRRTQGSAGENQQAGCGAHLSFALFVLLWLCWRHAQDQIRRGADP